MHFIQDSDVCRWFGNLMQQCTQADCFGGARGVYHTKCSERSLGGRSRGARHTHPCFGECRPPPSPLKCSHMTPIFLLPYHSQRRCHLQTGREGGRDPGPQTSRPLELFNPVSTHSKTHQNRLMHASHGAALLPRHDGTIYRFIRQRVEKL